MKCLPLALLLSASILVGQAAANPFARKSGNPGTLGSVITVPPEWAGVWETSDSTYDCAGVLTGTSTYTDTLCAGTRIYPDTTLGCSGSSTATTFDMSCSGSAEVFTDCQYTVNLESHGTRSGETFNSVATLSVVYSGTGLGCDLFPDHCSQTNSHSTRTGVAPAAYCATPAQPVTWGRMKVLYR